MSEVYDSQTVASHKNCYRLYAPPSDEWRRPSRGEVAISSTIGVTAMANHWCNCHGQPLVLLPWLTNGVTQKKKTRATRKNNNTTAKEKEKYIEERTKETKKNDEQKLEELKKKKTKKEERNVEKNKTKKKNEHEK